MARNWTVPAVCCIAILLGAVSGCVPQDRQLAMVVSPAALDFGSSDAQTFAVAKVFTSRPMPPFTATADQPWLVLSPTTGVSDGPQDPVIITASLLREEMSVGDNEAKITISAPGLVSKVVQVTAELTLVADFTANKSGAFVDEEIQFIDRSADYTGNGLKSWRWTFGDGTGSTERNPQHSYSAAGSYTVTLEVSNGVQTRSKVQPNFISISTSVPPTAEFDGVPRSIRAGESVRFLDQSLDGSLPITSWEWNFGDGSQLNDRFQQNPLHVYAVALQYGQYQYDVSLTVSSAIGSSTEFKADFITITGTLSRGASFEGEAAEGAGAEFEIAYPWEAPYKWFVTGEPVTLVNRTTTEPGLPVSYSWDLGDGNSTTTASPIHAYTQASGPEGYTVMLTARPLRPMAGESTFALDGLHVFPATRLDQLVRDYGLDFDTGLPVEASESSGGATIYSTAMESWSWGDDGTLVPFTNDLTVVVPQGSWAEAGLLVVGEYAEPTEALIAEAVRSETVVALLSHRLAEELGFPERVGAVVRAMDTVQMLLLGGEPVSSFALAGSGTDGWTAWLTATTDQRVCSLVLGGDGIGAYESFALQGVPASEAAELAQRLHIPIMQTDTTDLDGQAGIGLIGVEVEAVIPFLKNAEE